MRQDCTFFQSFAWNRLAARAFVGSEEPYCVMVSTDSGAAIIPAAITSGGKRVGLLGDALFDYRDVLAGGGDDALRRAWDELARLGLPMSVTAVRNSALHHWHGLGLSLFTQAPQVRHAEITAQEFEARHRRLGRLLRRCERAGASISHLDGRESKLLRWIYEQKALQFAGVKNNIFANERRVEFLVDAAAMRPHRCDIYKMQVRDRIVAALITFRDRSVRRFYTTYFNQDWARESPGQVLTYEVTRRSLSEALDCDYMTGEQQHKTRLATSSVPLFKVNATSEMLTHMSAEPVTQKAA